MSLVAMLAVTIAVLQVSVFITTIYLHRCLTHGGLQLHAGVRLLFHLHLALFTGIKPREWVAVHRKHHHFSDEEGDPHSPLMRGLWTVFLGNAILYRREAKNPATVVKYTPDYEEDLIDRFRIGGPLIFAGLALFMSLFGWLAGGLLFLVQAVAYILLNSSINSFCHVTGYRNYDNQATNVQTLALFTGGEALHNNHHEYPSSALFALRKGEFDPGWLVIRALEMAGLAKVNRLPIVKTA
ncbi:MAG: fatty acid desaturase [Acidobacteria bacterium]|nr:fatty acid desaturase [Acidobacteriota bacterium]